MNGPNSAGASARKSVKLTDEISAIRVVTSSSAVAMGLAPASCKG
jgi:hypothetical protein